MEEAVLGCRSSYRSQAGKIDSAVRGGRGGYRRFPALHAVAARLYALQPTIPHLTRSSLHRCLQRHGISRLPDVEGVKPAKKKFKSYPIGFFHIDIAEVRTEQGKLHMFVAIDRTSKFAYVELHESATTAVSREFLLRLIAAVPYKIHTVLTDNGIQFTTPGAGGSAVPLIKEAIANGELFWAHAFELACARNDIDHRTTKVKHPWTNGTGRTNEPNHQGRNRQALLL
jgi:transposase InsO family protein